MLCIWCRYFHQCGPKDEATTAEGAAEGEASRQRFPLVEHSEFAYPHPLLETKDSLAVRAQLSATALITLNEQVLALALALALASSSPCPPTLTCFATSFVVECLGVGAPDDSLVAPARTLARNIPSAIKLKSVTIRISRLDRDLLHVDTTPSEHSGYGIGRYPVQVDALLATLPEDEGKQHVQTAILEELARDNDLAGAPESWLCLLYVLPSETSPAHHF